MPILARLPFIIVIPVALRDLKRNMSEEVPIPEPEGLPILGNINNVDKEFPLGSMVSLADQFGEIYRMRFPGRTVVFVSTQALINETCDEKRFRKSINTTLSVRHPS